MSINMHALKAVLICTIGVAFLFSLFSLVFYFGDWTRLAILFFMGAFLGLIGAPELEPKAFKSPWLFQLIGGAVSGAISGLLLSASIEATFVLTLIGGVLGWLAPYWLKHAPIP